MARISADSTLSLKNIYRLLTRKDYPQPCEDPLGRDARRGMTVFTFWRNMLGVDMAVTPLGEKLWIIDERRNRYLSDLFNRSHPVTFYPEYFSAMADRVTPDLLLGILRRFDDFLRDASYNHEALCQRINAYLRLIAQQDTEVIPAVHTFLGELMWQAPDFDTDAERGRYFCAYVLAFLSLHAFFGLQMNNGPMGRLRRNAACQPEALFVTFRQQDVRGTARPEVLTLTACELCREPLEEGRFFGRAEELAFLRTQIAHGGKMLLSGMGGIGKTELLRQALATLLRGGLFARVAFIQYEGNLMDSFLRSFTNLHGTTPETRFSECLARLSLGSGRALLLIDNVDTPPGEDPALSALAGLGCDIVITSRLASLSGFRVIPVDHPGREAARQIFSAHYGQDITQEEQPLLDHLMEEHLGHHPLASLVLGGMARTRHLSIRGLYDSLAGQGLKGSFVQEAQQVQVEAVLRQLFQIDHLARHERDLLRLFALLPQRRYHFTSLQELMTDITEDRDILADTLERLRYLGWLSCRDKGYSMHPVIAETMLGEPLGAGEFQHFWAFISSKTQTDKYREWTYADIAQHALLKHGAVCEQRLGTLLNTAALMLELGMHGTVRRLLDAAKPCLDGSPPAGADQAFSYYMLSLSYLRASSRFEEARGIIPRLIALLPGTSEPGSRPIALGHAMFIALKLSMQAEIQQLYGLMAESVWDDAQEQAQQCYVMGEFHVYATRNPQEMMDWGDRGLSILDRAGLGQSLNAANLHHIRALGCAYKGLPEEAQVHIQQCKSILLDWYGDGESLFFATFDNSMGTAYDIAGEYDSALAHFHRALDGIRRVIPGDSFMTEDFLNNTANAYLHKGDLKQALAFCQEAFQMHERLNHVENLQTALLLNNMGCILRDFGSYQEALERFTRSRDIARALQGEGSIFYAEPTLNTGRLYLLMGDREQALAHIAIALPLFEAGYGADHPRTRMAREKHAEALASQA